MNWINYKGKYDISPEGLIRNSETCQVLKGTPNRKGYLNVTLYGKTVYLHRAVAETFLENADKLPQVNHKDGNKTNNDLENLEWITNSGNMQHAYDNGLINIASKSGENCTSSKLTEEEVLLIRDLQGSLPSREVGKIFNLNKTQVLRIWNRKNWKLI
jgi:hypothetical protein